MMRQIRFLGVLLITSNLSFGQESEAFIPVGVSKSIYSENLKEERAIFVSTPDSYLSSNEVYPLIILLDGYTHFKTTVGIIEFMSSQRTRNFQMSESVLVAIGNNKHKDRERDFTWTRIEMVRENKTGGGRTFLKFIEEELIPYINENYRVSESRTLIGHSLGGLFSVNTYLSPSTTFQSYVAIDPSIWWEDKLMNQKLDSMPVLSYEKKLFIATANVGPERNERNKGSHDKLFGLLNQKVNDSTRLEISYYENEDHRSVPLKAIYDGLKFVNKQ